MSDSICGEHHAGILCHSDNGIDWKLNEDPLAYSRTLTFENGETICMGQLERPFPLVEDGKVTTMFFGTLDGPGGFHNGTKSWNIAVPLRD